jgi:hypothetical protein
MIESELQNGDEDWDELIEKLASLLLDCSEDI